MIYFGGMKSTPIVSGRHLLSREQAADYLGIRPQTLAAWHCAGRYALPVVKVGRLAKYRLADLEHFLSVRTSTSTAAIAGGR
jgi:hypothetical protein